VTTKKLVNLFRNDLPKSTSYDQISPSGRTNRMPTSTTGYSLSTMNQKPQEYVTNEGLILRELIYALQGVDGRIFYKDPKDMQTIAIKIEMERSVKMHCLRYLECGWLYLRLRKFLATFNSNPSSGLVLQAFCAYIATELKEYHRLLAVLESQLGSKDSADSGNLTLRRLIVWLEQPIDRLKYLNIVCDAIKEKKGGVLLSTLHAYSIHGDPFKSSLIKSGLSKCVIPIKDMILEWICDGQIRDIHEEFFVAFDNSVSNDRLWHDKYNLRLTQIPTFMSESQARKVLIIGKSINFMRSVCSEQKQVQIVKSHATVESMLNQRLDSNFQEMIDTTYIETSRALIDILKSKYKLLEHFTSFKRYMLLGQGDFIRHLMDLMEFELDKPAKDLLYHNLQRLLDKALTETNAQYDPYYITSRLQVRLLTISPNDIGWDVFSLDYVMDGPLKTIFTTDCLHKYLRIFNFLWRVKRMEYAMCAIWCKQKADKEKFRTIKEIHEIIHQSNIISSEMLRLVQNINFYIMFEVLEVSWKNLEEKLNNSTDMDQIIAANEQFLEDILSQLLLDQQSVEIASELRTIFDLIIKLSMLNDDFYKVAINEYNTRNIFQAKLESARSSNNTEGTIDLEQDKIIEKRRCTTEFKPKLKATKNQLCLLKKSFNVSLVIKKLFIILN
jgi:gamma-tubulin complex component 3